MQTFCVFSRQVLWVSERYRREQYAMNNAIAYKQIVTSVKEPTGIDRVRFGYNMNDLNRRLVLPVLTGTSMLFFPGCGMDNDRVSPDNPNILIIYSDDQGLGDIGAFGGKNIHTPHTDRLAEQGIMFTQMYAPSSICTPSRAGLLTGRFPLRAGLVGLSAPPPLTGLDDGYGSPGLSNDQPSMAKLLREAGYRSAMIGKWHLGYDPGYLPDDHGFDHWFGHIGGVIDNYSHFFNWRPDQPARLDLWRNGERVRKPGNFFPDMMLREAQTFIGNHVKDHQKDPFFLYYSLNTPHWPYQGNPSWVEWYQDKGIPYPRDLYGAFISAQDERIGALLSTLEEENLIENTLIIFMSDNGHSVEPRAHFGGGDAGIYRGAKFSLFEGAIRVPGIISWPGIMPENEIRDQMVHQIDILPTLAEICGLELSQNEIDGKSILEVIHSDQAESPHDVLYWTRTTAGFAEDIPDQWAVRKGPWKLYANAFYQLGMEEELTEEDKKLFLANLDEDPGEKINLVNEYPEIVEDMRKLYEEWSRQYQ